MKNYNNYRITQLFGIVAARRRPVIILTCYMTFCLQKNVDKPSGTPTEPVPCRRKTILAQIFLGKVAFAVFICYVSWIRRLRVNAVKLARSCTDFNEQRPSVGWFFLKTSVALIQHYVVGDIFFKKNAETSWSSYHTKRQTLVDPVASIDVGLPINLTLRYSRAIIDYFSPDQSISHNIEAHPVSITFKRCQVICCLFLATFRAFGLIQKDKIDDCENPWMM